MSTLPDFIDSITEVTVRTIELDLKIAEDRLQYASWLIAIATAGFAISVTQGDKVLEDLLVGKTAGKWFLVVAAVLFGVSACLGAAVRLNIMKNIENSRQVISLLLLQKLVVAITPPANIEASDPYKLIVEVTSGHFLNEQKLARYKVYTAASSINRKRYESLRVWQQRVAAAGYLLLFICHLH
jgi:hypothetical protein